MAAQRAAGSVLIVEDDREIMEVLTDLLEAEGYRVATGGNAGGRIAAVAGPPDVVRLDLMMPVLGGAEVCRRLNADPRTERVPVVILTAMPPNLVASRLNGCAYDRVIHKPFSIDEILEVVQEHVGA